MMMKINRKQLLPLLVLFISSCKVSKEYQRPDLDLPAQYYMQSFSDTSTIADIEWNKFFNDPVLQGLIGRG
ncbi:MAG TPA: TolC family protein, partial [Chitinophagaceae bacterium]|nr:TolC family protein [Chitinophagaceae bacterium]